MESNPHRWVQALRASHDALMAQVRVLTPADLTHGSYCKDWDIAQVLSHLGSGAEISLLGLERALDNKEPLSREEFPLIWDRWNALGPDDKASQMVVWDRRHVSVLQGLDDRALKSVHLNFFGTELDAAGVVALRLGEHALHSWDVAVTFDPAAEVLPTSVELLVDKLPFLAGRLAKVENATSQTQVKVVTSRPDRRFLLSIGEGIALSKDVEGPVDGTLEIPSAAMLRLVYGRLDPDHTPSGIKTKGTADLDELRKIFRGF